LVVRSVRACADWHDEGMIEPVKSQIPGVHADEGVMWKFGDAGYVSVFADGHVRFAAYPPQPGMEVTHNRNDSSLPGSHVLIVQKAKPKKS
jgi:hypothetical protein